MTPTLTSDASASQPIERVAPGRWIPWTFVGLFLLVLAANSTMIIIAVSTFTGLETTKAYEKGLAYNSSLAAAAEQERWGWTADFVVKPKGGRRVALAFALADQLGNPINSAEVEVILLRPVQEGHDMTIHLDGQGHGRYAEEALLPLPGQWDIQLTATARTKSYKLTKRIHVTP